MRRILLLFSLVVLLILTYASIYFFNREIKLQRAFYYWQNQPYFLSDNESQTIKTLNVNKLYIKFFEVDKNDIQGIFPFAKNELNLSRYDSLESKIEVVPTIYIRNEVFKQTSRKEINQLAENLLFLIEKKFKKQFEENPIPKEIQMDCDWTESTKDNYMLFLNILKQKIKWRKETT